MKTRLLALSGPILCAAGVVIAGGGELQSHWYCVSGSTVPCNHTVLRCVSAEDRDHCEYCDGGNDPASGKWCAYVSWTSNCSYTESVACGDKWKGDCKTEQSDPGTMGQLKCDMAIVQSGVCYAHRCGT